MNTQNWSELCGPSVDGSYLARTAQGDLFKGRNGAWEAFDFNRAYNGYYPACAFTKLCYFADQFYLAGVDGGGISRLFVSLMGSVWEERNIHAYHPLYGTQIAQGRIVEMLYDEAVHQVFLITDQGQLLVLPDCPKCVRIIPIKAGAVAGRLEDGYIKIRYPDHTTWQTPVAASVQFRVSMSYMRERLHSGALLVDVRSEELHRALPIEGSLSIPADDVADWLRAQKRDREMYFVCMYGVQADRAAESARRMGFSRAFSVGGIKELAHLE